MVSIQIEEEAIRLRSTGNDPQIRLPEFALPPGYRAQALLDITAPGEDEMEIHYIPDDDTAAYSDRHRAWSSLAPGRNRVLLTAFPMRGGVKGHLRFDPGVHAGDYLLHRLEIFAVKGDSVIDLDGPDAQRAVSPAPDTGFVERALPAQGEFDEARYLEHHADVAEAVRNKAMASGWEHFERFGFKEKRRWFRRSPAAAAPAGSGRSTTPTAPSAATGRVTSDVPVQAPVPVLREVSVAQSAAAPSLAAALEEAVAQEPEAMAPRLHLGAWLLEQGRLAEAEAQARKAATLIPASKTGELSVAKLLGLVCLRQSNLEEATTLLTKYVQSVPSDVAVRNALVQCLNTRGFKVLARLMAGEGAILEKQAGPARTAPKRNCANGPARAMAPLLTHYLASPAVRKSCPYIESGLILHQNHLRVCCSFHHGGGSPQICEYSGGPFPMDKVLAKRNEIKEANRIGTFPACKGCAFLEEREWPEQPSHLVSVMDIAMSAACQLRCNYCYTVRNPEIAGNSTYDLHAVCREFLEKGWLSPQAHIVWTGGEPTLFKRFDDVLDLMMAGGISHRIFTNGFRYSDSVAHGVQADQVQLICSLDAGTPETYAAVKGRQSFEQVKEVCSRYARLGGDFRLKYVCVPENANPKDAEGFVELVRQWQIRNVFLDVDHGQPNEQQAIIDTLAHIMAKARQAGVRVEFYDGVKGYPELRLPERIEQGACLVEARDAGRDSLRPGGRGVPGRHRRLEPAAQGVHRRF